MKILTIHNEMLNKRDLIMRIFIPLILLLSTTNLLANTKIFVETIPKYSQVKILNIKHKFKQGIALKKGIYIFSVRSKGHVPKKFSIRVAKKKILKLRVNLLSKRFINSVGMEFIYIKPGSFMMGSPQNERGRLFSESRFKVTLTKSYRMQITEVSEGQFENLMAYNPSRYKKGNNYPVENVSWKDANTFIRLLNKKEKTQSYRLPTEAEWEYACRAGTKTPFSFGNCINTNNQVVFDGEDSYNNCKKSNIIDKQPIKSLLTNQWGLYHMHGNVSEWCIDYWGVPETEISKKKYPDYSFWISYKKHRKDYVNFIKTKFRVVKGGAWDAGAADSRSASRSRKSELSTYDSLGFRVVKSIETKDYEVIK